MEPKKGRAVYFVEGNVVYFLGDFSILQINISLHPHLERFIPDVYNNHVSVSGHNSTVETVDVIFYS